MKKKKAQRDEHEMKCNEVLPHDGIKLALDGTPTTEKEPYLLIAMLRGASNHPWCGI